MTAEYWCSSFECLDPLYMTQSPTQPPSLAPTKSPTLEPTMLTSTPTLFPSPDPTSSPVTPQTLFALDFEPETIFDVIDFDGFGVDELAIVLEPCDEFDSEAVETTLFARVINGIEPTHIFNEKSDLFKQAVSCQGMLCIVIRFILHFGTAFRFIALLCSLREEPADLLPVEHYVARNQADFYWLPIGQCLYRVQVESD